MKKEGGEKKPRPRFLPSASPRAGKPKPSRTHGRMLSSSGQCRRQTTWSLGSFRAGDEVRHYLSQGEPQGSGRWQVGTLPWSPFLTADFPALQFPAACRRVFALESSIERGAIDKAVGGQSHLTSQADGDGCGQQGSTRSF